MQIPYFSPPDNSLSGFIRVPLGPHSDFSNCAESPVQVSIGKKEETVTILACHEY